VPPEELIGLLHGLDASEIDAALTDAEREFLCEAAKTWPLNFPLADLLVAKECERMGVVSLTGAILSEDGTYFRMAFTGRCSPYVLASIFTPPDNQDLALFGS